VKEACSLCLTIEHGDCSATLLELAPILGGALSRSCPGQLAKLVGRLGQYSRSALPPQRCASLALLADLLNYRCNDNPVLVESVLATLNTGWKDEDPRVRAACLRGAANVGQLKDQHR
ncbi:jg19805, partial [Pararge aegeria aegeria]